MKKRLFSLFAFLLFLPSAALAQSMEFNLSQIRPVITSENIVRVNRNIIFDASSTFAVEGEEQPEVTYEWDLGDGNVKTGEEIVHTYAASGSYTVNLAVTQGDQTESIQKEVFAYDKLIVLLMDDPELSDKVTNLKEEAAAEGTFLSVIQGDENAVLTLGDNLNVMKNADGIAILTSQGAGVSALTSFVQQRLEQEGGAEDIQEMFGNKSILVLTDRNIDTLGRILQGSFNIIHPKQMIIARQYELRNFIGSPSDEVFLESLQNNLSEYRLVNEDTGKVGVLNSLSYLVSFMVSKGIPTDTIMLLLMLPVIATLIALLKQVVGMTTFGVYTPSIITLSFLALGLEFGLVILLIIIATGALVRRALNRFHLLHTPRVAIVLTFSSLIILLTLAFGTYLNINTIATIAVFPMLIMTTLAEKFVSALSGRGFFPALLLMFETTLVSLICYFVVEWDWVQELMLGRPEIILLLLVFNYGLGRWTGLRVMEYVRFREVMKHTEE